MGRATEALALLVKRLPGSLDVSVFRYDMLMHSIVLLATSMRDATMEETPAKRASATAAAFRRAENILRNRKLLAAARTSARRDASSKTRAAKRHGTDGAPQDANYKRAAQEAGMYVIPDEVYLKALAAKSLTAAFKRARRPRRG